MQKAASDDKTTAVAVATPWQRMAYLAASLRGARGRRARHILIGLVGPLAAVTVGLWIYLSGGRYVSTDNAYVKADRIAISPDISGRVVAVAVKADQPVERGALLFRIDPEPHRISLERAEARLAASIRDMEALQALYQQRMARRLLAEGDVVFHTQAHERQMQLGRKGIVSKSGMDTAERNLRNARDQITIAEQDIAEIKARLGDPETPVSAHPTVREARALRDQAALDLARTEVKAPAAGVVTNFDLLPGEYVAAGKVAFSLVSTEHIWIQANFKETDLTHVKSGQPAVIRIDTYPDNDRQAYVTSISSATGSEFAVLPPQNATGNWVKVVQRLPVRLKLVALPGQPPLRAGMSVTVTIDTGQKRQMPHWASALTFWAAAGPGPAAGSKP